jgi:hypothetical protein
MVVRVREKIDIHGVGTDVVEMQGVFTVRRDHPCAPDGQLEWGKSCIKTEFRSLELDGESLLFGTVRVHLDPEHSSHGEVMPADQGSLAANCVAHCYPVIEIPRLGMRLTTQGKPIDLASKVIQIPPVGDVARSGNSAELIDDSGAMVGELISSDIEVGEVLWSQPLGDTLAQGEQPAPHNLHDHEKPSGSGFYTTVPSDSAGEPDPHDGMPGMGDMHARMQTGEPSQPQAARTLPAELVDRISRLEDEVRDLVQAIQSLAGSK